MRDELNKLADRVETIATDWRYSDEEDRRNAIAADLRAIAASCGSGVAVGEVVFDPRPDFIATEAWIDRKAVFVDLAALPVGSKLYTAPPPPAATPRQIEQCCVCGKRFDAREQSEGGGQHGAELSDGRWVDTPECFERAATPNAQAGEDKRATDAGAAQPTARYTSFWPTPP